MNEQGRKERCDKKIQDLLVELGAVKDIKRLRVEAKQDELEESFIAYELFIAVYPNGIAYEIIKRNCLLLTKRFKSALQTLLTFKVCLRKMVVI